MGIEDDDKPAAEPEVTPSAEGQISIDLNDVDEEEEPAKTGAGAQAIPEDRKGRRAQFRELKQAKVAAEERYLALERQVAELRGRLSIPAAPALGGQPQQPVDPFEDEIESLFDQQQMLLQAISQATSDAQVKERSEQWRKLDKKRRALEIQQHLNRTGVGQQRSNGADPIQVANQLLQSEFPEVFQSEPMRKRAEAELEELVSRGKPHSIATAREAAERILERYQLRKGKPPAPTAAEQARYTSVSSRAGANGSGSSNYVPSQNVLRTARAWSKHLPDLSDEERVRLWIQKVAKPGGIQLT